LRKLGINTSFRTTQGPSADAFRRDAGVVLPLREFYPLVKWRSAEPTFHLLVTTLLTCEGGGSKRARRGLPPTLPSGFGPSLPAGFGGGFAASLTSGFAVSRSLSFGRKFVSSGRSGFESAEVVSQASDFPFSLLVSFPAGLPVIPPRGLLSRFRFTRKQCDGRRQGQNRRSGPVV